MSKIWEFKVCNKFFGRISPFNKKSLVEGHDAQLRRNMSPPKVSIQPLDPSTSSPKLIRWAAFGLLASVLGYFAVRHYSIAQCKVKDCEGNDPIQNLLDDFKQDFDKRSDMWVQKVKGSFFTKGILEAFDVIYGILDNLNEFGLSGQHYKTPRLILLGLIKRAQEDRQAIERNSMTEAQSEIEISPESFNFAKHIGYFAINVYYASWLKDTKSISKAVGLENPEDVLFTWFQDSGDDHCPKFAIFRDHKTKSILLTIRGTFSLADAISDIVCDEDQFLDGFAHRGILNGARKILKEAEPHLKEAFANNPDYSLVITGHSLGAGTAELITLNILAGNVDYIDPTLINVRCIALAPPPVYRSETTKLPKSMKDKIEIFINNNDCVPRLSLGVIAKLLSMMKAVDSLTLSTYEQLQILAGSKDSKAAANLKQITESLDNARQDKFPFLQHPGRIFYLCRQNDLQRPLLIFRRPSRYFSDELLFLETMILDHLHPYYKEAFAKVLIENKEEEPEEDQPKALT